MRAIEVPDSEKPGAKWTEYLAGSAIEGGSTISVCTFSCGGRHFGIETTKICEVLRAKTIQRVPLAPAFIAGVVTYRGEMLTVVSFSALLSLPTPVGEPCVMVLDGGVDGEHFGVVVVDNVGGVVTLNRNLLTVNPVTLDDRAQALYEGAYRMPNGLLVQLSPERLRPERLAETGLFAKAAASQADQREARQEDWRGH